MAKKILEFDVEEHLDFELLGIVCAYKDFRLCFEINEAADLGFKKAEDLLLKLERRHSTSTFSLYQFINIDEEEYFLIANKGSNGNFIPEQKHIDYFMILRNKAPFTFIEKIIDRLNTISIINSVIQLNPSSLKSAGHFLYIEADTKAQK